MNELEEKVNRIINSLSKEELIELKKQIMTINFNTFIMSNDNENIASYLNRFNYNESKKEEFLKRF